MANEITVTAKLEFNKGGVSDLLARALQQFTMTGTDWIHRSQVIGSSAEALDIGEIGTAGWAIFYHTGLDSSGAAVTDTIKLRMGASGTDLAYMKAGEPAGPFRLASNTPYAIASSTGAPKLEYLILED